MNELDLLVSINHDKQWNKLGIEVPNLNHRLLYIYTLDRLLDDRNTTL